MAWILIETADRETGVLEFKTREDARKAMLEAFREIMDYEGDTVNSEEDMKCILDILNKEGYYEDDVCGLSEYEGWYNRSRGGHLDWVMHEINTAKACEDAVDHYHNTITSVMSMKATMAQDEAEQEEDPDCYNAAWLEGYTAGLKEAKRALEASTFLYKGRS